MSNELFVMILWLGELTVSSWILSNGADRLSHRFGAKFVGRVLLSIATTLPEIAIVIYAASKGAYGIAIGAGLGSNLLMMTLGLSIMLLIATTRLSKNPIKGIDVTHFRLDKVFLIFTAIAGAILFINGYDIIDGFLFVSMFIAYVIMAFREMINDRHSMISYHTIEQTSIENLQLENSKFINKEILKPVIIFLIGTIGIIAGAGPFINSLEGFSEEVGVSTIILSVIISPIAGEMPEKISLMLLARKGATGASIAIANVLGSKILNNSLLLGTLIFAAVYHGGFHIIIPTTPLLIYQVILVTMVTLVSVLFLFKKKIGIRSGIVLTMIYIISIAIQFSFPRE